MAYTITQLQALQDALASGQTTVTYDGKSVTYRSIAELKSAISEVKAELIAAGTIADTTPRRSVAVFSRG